MHIRVAISCALACAVLVGTPTLARAQEQPVPPGCVVTSAGLQCPQLPPGCIVTSAGAQCPSLTPAPVPTQAALGVSVTSTPTPTRTPTPTSTPRKGTEPKPPPASAPPPRNSGVPILAFTGHDAFPLALVGTALLAAGLLLRRRSRTAWAVAVVPPAASLPQATAPIADAAPRSAGSQRAATFVLGAVVLGVLLRRGRP
jgi:hypothetical protein